MPRADGRRDEHDDPDGDEGARAADGQARTNIPITIPPTTRTTTSLFSDGDFAVASAPDAGPVPPWDAPVTITVPFIHGCGVQMKLYFPALSKTTTAERLCPIRPVSNAPVTDVIVCEIRPRFVTTTFWPTFTRITGPGTLPLKGPSADTPWRRS